MSRRTALGWLLAGPGTLPVTRRTWRQTGAGLLPTTGLVAFGAHSVRAQPAGPVTIAFLDPYPTSEHWQRIQLAAERRAARDGAVLTLYGLTAASVPEQLAQIDDALAQGVAALLIGPIDAAGIVPGIEAANARGVPVVAMITEPPGGDLVCLVFADQVAAARAAGAFIGTAIGGAGLVLNMQGDLGDRIAQERDRGLREGLAAFPEVELTSQTAGWRENEAFTWMRSALAQVAATTPAADQPPLRAVFAAGDLMTLGVLRALAEHADHGLTVVGFADGTAVREAIRDGRLAAAVTDLPEQVGEHAVDLTLRHLGGEQVPRSHDVGYALLTPDSLDEATPIATPEPVPTATAPSAAQPINRRW